MAIVEFLMHIVYYTYRVIIIIMMIIIINMFELVVIEKENRKRIQIRVHGSNVHHMNVDDMMINDIHHHPDLNYSKKMEEDITEIGYAYASD